MKKTIILSTVLLFVAMKMLSAHGVNIHVEMQYPSVIVKSSFSATQPLADALVTIYSPWDNDNAWQKGRTDRAGYFLFMPGEEGDWTFIVDDQKGHTKKMVISVTDDFFDAGEPETPSRDEITHDETAGERAPAGIPDLYKLIFGLSIIFGITGIYYGIRVKQSQVNK